MERNRTQQLGHRSFQIPSLGLGLAALGRPGYINLGHGQDLGQLQSGEAYGVAAMQDHAFAVLDEAWRLGIRYFDAARSYGRAEEFLGNWIRQRKIGPNDVIVASKWGYTYTAAWQVEAEDHEVKEHSLSVLRRQWGETEERLGGHLDLYQIHSATFDSGVLDNGEVHGELARLKAGGTAIGLTLSGPDQARVLERALVIKVDGSPLFDAVQATWNLLEPSAGNALAQASASGLLVIIKETLANGRLTERNDAPAFAEKLSLLRREAERLGTTVDAVALAAVLAQPWVGVALSGAAAVDHVSSNIGALSVAWDDEAARQLTALAEPAEQYWQTRSNLTWN